MHQKLVALEAENRRLRMEREILKKAAAFFCKGKHVRYEFIKMHKKAYPVTLMCNILRVSSSGFHSWLTRPPSQNKLINDVLDCKIITIYR